jgi:hypothetical protein
MITIPIQILVSATEFERYVTDCLTSLRQQQGLGKKYRLIVHVGIYEPIAETQLGGLEAFQDESFTVKSICIDRKCGYGEKQNLMWTQHSSKLSDPFDAFMTINPDMILLPDVVDKLYSTYENEAGQAFIVEARQFPVENPPRVFDPQTQEVDWCSGACILISRAFFEREGGFDENIFLYCEDVDLSWRAWLAGRKCIYRYDAIAAHITRALFEERYNSFSVPVHEYYMALSHLILTWKYFSHQARVYEEKMKLFWAYEWIAHNTKEAALAEFQRLQLRIRTQTKLHPRIKILDLGLYSAMRPSLIG